MKLLSNYSGNLLEVGTDECGRGCLSGPVVAAACILPIGFEHPKLNDSKKMKEADRIEVYEFITNNKECIWAISSCTEETIDKINILQASLLSMHLSIKQLTTQPEFIIVDGNQWKDYNNIPHACIIKGDSKYASIAAASVLAKVYRDRYMVELDKLYPMYDWKTNKGYAVPKHRDGIKQFGLTQFHRKSFCSQYLNIQKKVI